MLHIFDFFRHMDMLAVTARLSYTPASNGVPNTNPAPSFDTAENG